MENEPAYSALYEVESPEVLTRLEGEGRVDVRVDGEHSRTVVVSGPPRLYTLIRLPKPTRGLLELLSVGRRFQKMRYHDRVNQVQLLTIHAAKGLEWPTIFLCGLEQGLFPLRPALSSEEELEEERRLMYVAITRAKERLYLLWSKERTRFGRPVRNKPSQFLTEMIGRIPSPQAGSGSASHLAD